jgi:hypothetical protein
MRKQEEKQGEDQQEKRMKKKGGQHEHCPGHNKTRSAPSLLLIGIEEGV